MTLQPRQRMNRPLLLIGGALLLLAAAALLLFGGALLRQGDADAASPRALPTTGPPLNVGDRPYAFTLVNLDGETISLEDHLGRPIVINFWASWCAPCRVEMPAIQAAYDRHRDKGLTILALNQNESAKAAELFFRREMALTFANPLLDDGGRVFQNYGARNLPTTIFIDPAGVIQAIHRGPATASQLVGYLAEILP